MDKATPTPSPASVDKQAALVAKLRYMGKQYAAGQVARGGSPQKHYLEEAAEEIEMMAWALSMSTKTPASAQENADLRNVIQAACIDGLPGLSRAWEKYFPNHPITIKGAEVERLAAQAAPSSAIIASLCGDVEPFVFEEYPYNSEAMGCGLEDRDITDRYEAMAYGWSAAMERAAEAIPDDLYSASTVAALKARVAVLEKDAERYRQLRRGQKWSVVDGIGTVLRADELDAAIDAALTKGQQ